MHRRLLLVCLALFSQYGIAAGTAVEFFNARLQEYFITADAAEIAALDGGTPPGWKETGYAFSVGSEPASKNLPVCRFFSATFAPKSSHFYTPYADECVTLKAGLVWTYESVAFYLALPLSDGACEPNQTAIYRLYNNGMSGAPNHRYTSAAEVVVAMQAAGWVLEGSAATGIFACGPAAPSGGTDVIHITSSVNSQIYDVAIYVPQGYDTNSAPLPVIYALDAQLRYRSLLDAMKRVGAKVILVQIYDMGRRQTDFNVPGAFWYLQFLKKDLIPYVESRYRADARKRIISGLSTGGNFPFHALYYETPGPWTFAHYWSTEGAFWQQQDTVYSEEAAMYDLIRDGPFPVTLALAGGSGNGALVKQLYETLVQKHYRSLQLIYLPYPFGHVETDVPAFVDELGMLCGASNCRGLEH